MINRVLIYLSYHSYTIVKVLFIINFVIITIFGLFFENPIKDLLGFVFFFCFGLYIGFWLLYKIIGFIKEEESKENKYLQKLINKRSKKTTLYVAFKNNMKEQKK